MTEEELEKLRFPVGTFDNNAPFDSADVLKWREIIELFPTKLKEALSKLSQKELTWRYRPGGWTIAQVVHHCSNSHLNSLVRFKLALTENHPTIKPYEEQLCAELTDSKSLDVNHSLTLLENLRAKWVLLLKNLSEDDMKRCFQHPSEDTPRSIAQNIGI